MSCLYRAPSPGFTLELCAFQTECQQLGYLTSFAGQIHGIESVLDDDGGGGNDDDDEKEDDKDGNRDKV